MMHIHVSQTRLPSRTWDSCILMCIHVCKSVQLVAVPITAGYEKQFNVSHLDKYFLHGSDDRTGRCRVVPTHTSAHVKRVAKALRHGRCTS